MVLTPRNRAVNSAIIKIKYSIVSIKEFITITSIVVDITNVLKNYSLNIRAINKSNSVICRANSFGILASVAASFSE